MSKINFGRKRIVLDYDEVTPENFKEVFADALPIFNSNARDCKYLLDMYLGKQDILGRRPPNTSNINNKCVVNYAFPITREIVGYTFGNPFEFIPINEDNRKDVLYISDVMNYEDSYAVDINTAMYSSICGFGYEIILPSSDISKDYTPDIPVNISVLDPVHTFVVQSTAVGNPQIMSCIEICDVNGRTISYMCFTNKYKFTVDGLDFSKITVEDNAIGLDPIVMVENSLLLTGDWEQAIPIMNALNQLTSDTLNDVEGTIKSLLVILGTDLGDSKETLANIKDKRLLSLFNATGTAGGAVDAKFISPELNSQEVSEIRDFLDSARNIITGIPDRQTNGSTGGDTGTAVINRNGWTDIEIVAKLKELLFKKSKKRQLSIIISILDSLNLLDTKISAKDIDVVLGRNTLDNLSTKATAFSTLVATGELATIDCLDLSGLTNRTNEVIARGEEAKAQRANKENNANLPNNNSDDIIVTNGNPNGAN